MCKILGLLIALSLASAALAGNTSAPPGAYAYIISPKHGEVVSRPVKVVFGLSGIGIAPAGMQKDNTGHHHLLIDTELPPMDLPILTDEQHMHFGGGQTEVVIELAPGEHSLQLLVGDFSHIPHNPPVMSERIAITVK